MEALAELDPAGPSSQALMALARNHQMTIGAGLVEIAGDECGNPMPWRKPMGLPMRNWTCFTMTQVPHGGCPVRGSGMKTLGGIRRQLASGEFEFSRHAFKRAVERNISELEIRQAGAKAMLIEDYPDDKYSPSCLLLGFTETERPLHLQVSYADIELVRIITLYEPNETEWYDYTHRR